ncbi:MAG: prepilin-type N-terminal cleavage/methylation domain-containing protein [Candidatus Paceibacterota bacterium]|jgi:prepilin-type N-terminal cleavage/methylation domain-containing protein
MNHFQFSIFNFKKERRLVSPKQHEHGYTLIELVVAVGLFSFIMMLSSGAYLMMIGVNHQAQSIATGINDLSFALETMTREIRTGSQYSCGGLGDCPSGASSFSFMNKNGELVTYDISAGVLRRTVGASVNALTGTSVNVSGLTFYASGTKPVPTDYEQARVSIIISGTVSAGAGKPDQSFTVETGATMRGTDL